MTPQDVPNPPSPRRKIPLWIAVVPAVIAMVFLVNNVMQFSRVAGAISPSSGHSGSKRLDCVETYGVTLNTSDEYVPELMPGVPTNMEGKPRELSTVVRGVARNGCDANLTNVRIKFAVRDDNGKRGDGTFVIESLAIGEVKPFERAWMGRVASYDITAER